MREWRTSGIRSFVLTSVRDGADTSIALALADELTDLGVHALAIEASLTGSNGRRLKAPSKAPSVAVVPTVMPAAVTVSARATTRLVPRIGNTGTLEVKAQSSLQSVTDTGLQRASNGAIRTFGYVRETVDRVLGNHDIVLLAAPPLLSSADAIAFVQIPAGAILVARAGHDDVSELAAAVRELERCVPPVVGAVFCDSSWSEADGEYQAGSKLSDRHSSANRA